MKSSSKGERRAYESPLRKDQADATRARLVEAVLAEAKESGTGDVSMIAVARRAQVAAPTVYRHFPTRKELLEALHAHVNQMMPPPPPTGDWKVDVRALYRWRGETQDAIGPFTASSFVWDLRRQITVPARRARVEEMIEREVPGVGGALRTTLVDLLIVTVSDSMVAAFRGYLGLDPDVAADRAIWAIEGAFEQARREVAAARRRGEAAEAPSRAARTKPAEHPSTQAKKSAKARGKGER